MNWLDAVERTVTALGYDLVDTERAAGGLLRVYLDRVPGKVYDTGPGEFITVDDCEKVTRQLQHVLEVEDAPYERLEVSSPGLDRPLTRESDYERFVGEMVALTLKLPFQGRKKYQGTLQRGEASGQWRIELDDGGRDAKGRVKKKPHPKAKKADGGGSPVGATSGAIGAAEESRLKALLQKQEQEPGQEQAQTPEQALEQERRAQQALDFSISEVREARLVPVLDFKGRRFVEPANLHTAPAESELVTGDQEDGGRDK